MKAKPINTVQGLRLEGPLLITPKTFGDERGFFYESWNQRIWSELLLSFNQTAIPFVQDNHSRSHKGVLRGLHYQLNPCPQGKLVRCVSGEIYDVAVDLRRNSDTFGQWVSAYLSAENHQQLWIPVGFAHGFLTLSDIAEVLYKTTDFWDSDSERSIRWNDSKINIFWPNLVDSFFLSDKDKAAPLLEDIFDKELFQ